MLVIVRAVGISPSVYHGRRRDGMPIAHCSMGFELVIDRGDCGHCQRMHKITLTASSFVLALAACTPSSPADESDSSETGDGDEDPGDGDEDPGDGDGDPGDGDGDDEAGDGDGDPSCACPAEGPWDQCGVAEQPLLLNTGFGWPQDFEELELDELCTVASIEAGVTVMLGCASGEVEILIETEPAWVPAFAVGEQVHLRASESSGEGDLWAGFGWRIDSADDSQMLANYVSTDDSTPNLIGDPYAIDIVSGVCQAICDDIPEAGVSEQVGVRFTDADDELLLFAGQSSELGDQLIRVAAAKQVRCSDGAPGNYHIFISQSGQ